MRKFKRTISATALLIAIVMCFSGCSVIDYARKALKRDTPAAADSPEIIGVDDGVLPDNGTQSTNTAVVTSAAGSSSASTTSKPANGGSANAKPSQNKDTSSSTKNDTVSTTSANKTDDKKDDELTTDEIKDMPVKEVQDLLFATEDPNTAGKILTVAGFQYDEKQGIYYSSMNPLQRKFGFNFLYDMAAPVVGMNYATKRIEFKYGGKEWMVQIWKGQYGITAGAEIGLYSRDPSRVMQYDCADDEELIEMQFDFYNMGEYVFSRGPEKHWWLTGFKVAHIGVPVFIEMDMTLNFEDNLMANQFEKALKDVCAGKGSSVTDMAEIIADPISYTRKGSTFNIVW